MPAASPSASMDGVATPEVAGAAGRQPLHGLRVLLVEDDRDTADALALLLGHSGADVTVAGTSAEAFERFSQRAPDVLVSDIGLPDEDGYRLIARVRALPAGARIPAIAVTAFAGTDHARKALDSGFHAHLAKPFHASALVREIVTLCDGNGPSREPQLARDRAGLPRFDRWRRVR
jgi:CheY-like chemotaxis protein